jgi:FlaG/FlaF family flagellin (archaellin)
VIYIAGRGFTNKAVSQVIAALLLIAISVAAAVLVYVFSIGLLGSLQSSGGQQAKQQVIMEAYNWPTGTPGLLTLTLRNTGPAAVQFADWFINGVAVATVAGTCTPFATNPLAVGSSCQLTLTPPDATIAAGVAYVIKGVSVDGAVFSYSAIYGQAS